MQHSANISQWAVPLLITINQSRTTIIYIYTYEGYGLWFLDLSNDAAPDVFRVWRGVPNAECVRPKHRYLLLNTIHLCHTLQVEWTSHDYHVMLMWPSCHNNIIVCLCHISLIKSVLPPVKICQGDKLSSYVHTRERERKRERERERERGREREVGREERRKGLNNLDFCESDIVSTFKVVSGLIRACHNTLLLLQG